MARLIKPLEALPDDNMDKCLVTLVCIIMSVCGKKVAIFGVLMAKISVPVQSICCSLVKFKNQESSLLNKAFRSD